MIHLVERIALSAMGGFIPSPARIKRNVIGYAIIGLFLLTAYVALVVGGALYVAEIASPVAAAFLVAVAAIAAALIALAVMHYLERRARIRAILLQSQAVSLQSQVMGALYPQLPILIRQSPIASTIMVASLAFAMAKAAGLSRK